jgi:hypothetical protein
MGGERHVVGYNGGVSDKLVVLASWARQAGSQPNHIPTGDGCVVVSRHYSISRFAQGIS